MSLAGEESGSGALSSPTPPHCQSQTSVATLPMGTRSRFLDGWIERKPFLTPSSLPTPPQFSSSGQEDFKQVM